MFHVLTLNATRMDGNPHLNFAWQNAMEMPAIYIGQYLGDRIGRRYTQIGSYILGFLICIPILALVRETEYTFVIACLALAIRFVTGANFFAAHLQAMEIFPTCLRSSGLAIMTIAANGFGLLTPWVIYLVRNKL